MRILDTDHCVALLRGRLDVARHSPADEALAVTAVTVAELSHGAHRSSRREQNLASLDVFLAAVTVLDFDEAAGRRFGRLRAQLEAEGSVVGDLDLQIAAIALDHDRPLATHNTAHFARVPGLRLEDWLE